MTCRFRRIKGLITEFHRILENRLAQLMGEKPRIWRDQKLSGSDIFDEQIVQQFKNTKLMVSALSPRYIKSNSATKRSRSFTKMPRSRAGWRWRVSAASLRL